MRSYDDIILGRIDEAEMCLENEWFIAALTLALTLPDICGKAEYPDETVTARYIQWFNTYVKQYDKPKSKLSEDMPYLSGEVVYNLRNNFLHAGNPNIEKEKVKEEVCQIDRFHLNTKTSLLDDTSIVAYTKELVVKKREYSVNLWLLCKRLCKAAKEYYLYNREKFDFLNYDMGKE